MDVTRHEAPPPTLGVDVGGTFTDFALWDGRRIEVGKLSTTTDDQSRAVIAGATRMVPPGVRAALLHGTTAATNALLERRGARCLLVTDAGFESLLEIARQDRPSLYDPFADRSPPLVEADHRHGTSITATTTDDELAAIAADLAAAVDREAIEAIAICLLFSFADPIPETRLTARLNELVDVPISASSQVVAEFREYERMSTTVLNAFLSPEIRAYMEHLRQRAQQTGLLHEPAVMRSSGGLTSLERAASLPSSILLSGPAGGVVATAALGETMHHETLISFDMGGTSTDVCRIEKGRPAVTYQRDIGGYACLMPAVAVHTVGAGGGSIAWADEGGALRVGPRSAGAVPGPACYGRGGSDPTVTDANVVLGRLDPQAQLADAVTLRADLAVEAFTELGDRIGLDPVETALGVIAVVESHMAHAIRSVSVEQGADPRRAVLVAFGGAGGLHASSLARQLGMRAVVVPAHSGVFSALGLLLTPPRADAGRTVNLALHGRNGDGPDGDRVQADLAAHARALAEDARAQLRVDSRQEPVETTLFADMRYVGQSHETPVSYAVGETWEQLRRRYDELHAQRNGFARPDDDVEVVTVRAEALGTSALGIADLPPFVQSDEAPRRGSRSVTTPTGPVPADVWWRPAIPVGTGIEGPAVIEEGEATTYLGVGETAVVHPTGALEIRWPT